MNYFVCADNSPYFQWQLDLLLESFKLHGTDDLLLVALVPSSQAPQPLFCTNLRKHPRIMAAGDIGRLRGYERLTPIYAISSALKAGHLRQPFMIVRPDCVMFDPPSVKSEKVAKIVVQGDPLFTLDSVRENIPNLHEYFGGKEWPTVGNIMYFDKIPPEFFSRVSFLTELLAYEQLKNGKNIWPDTDRAAWAVVISEMITQTHVQIVYTWEMPLVASGAKHNFISYEKGVPAHFSKPMFMFNPISFGDPYEILKSLPTKYHTEAIEYISRLSKKCLEKRKQYAKLKS